MAAHGHLAGLMAAFESFHHPLCRQGENGRGLLVTVYYRDALRIVSATRLTLEDAVCV